jgi:hypothetical protein
MAGGKFANLGKIHSGTYFSMNEYTDVGMTKRRLWGNENSFFQGNSNYSQYSVYQTANLTSNIIFFENLNYSKKQKQEI